jgi:FKBP-type peptidyl-prolyl cis-trans isomerase
MRAKLIWMAVLTVGLLTAQAGAEDAPVLKNQNDKVNYSIGVGVARNFQRQGMEVDPELVVKGFRDALSGGKLLMSEDDLKATMNKFQAEVRLKVEQARRIAAVDNKKAGDAFLAENKTKEGVVTLPSGLQYRILRAGDGKKPTDSSTIECRYRGALINGAEFDSSERSGQPTVTLEMKGLIAGFREALKLMPVGSKWQLFIPPELAYGPRGSGMDIGPNATLVFEFELVAIK